MQERGIDKLAFVDMDLREMGCPDMDGLNIELDEIEEMYIDNAGLVILWRFLERFFESLALTDEGRFVDGAAQQRAIGLLHTVATGEVDAAEHRVTLNKVLCGLPVTDVFDFGPRISAAESKACEDLVRAVIAQAPILGEMSPDGLRDAFLRRAGVLHSRDGAWLLQVERENYDVVLDRSPWDWQLFRLPWMDTALNVEW